MKKVFAFLILLIVGVCAVVFTESADCNQPTSAATCETREIVFAFLRIERDIHASGTTMEQLSIDRILSLENSLSNPYLTLVERESIAQEIQAEKISWNNIQEFNALEIVQQLRIEFKQIP